MTSQLHKNLPYNSASDEKIKAARHYQTADKSLAKELIQHSKNNRKEPTAAESLV